jgi:GDPmannose 4,6-dehydratase
LGLGVARVALITGITGQTGSYLAELLLSKGYEVHGLIRRSSSFNTGRIDHIFNQVKLHYGDMTDGMGLMSVMEKVKPDEVYNLAAQSHVAVSFELPEYTANVDALGCLRLLDIITTHYPYVKYYQASTSELFGSAKAPQNELTPFQPQSPYAAAKLYAFWLTKQYREGYNIKACNGILFNHESPRRGKTFVTRKITSWLAERKLGLTDEPLKLGNVYAKRDWSHAKDMAAGIYLMMTKQGEDAKNWHDYVLGSGVSHTVLDFLRLAMFYADIDDFIWNDNLQAGFSKKLDAFKPIVIIDPKYYRPLEVDVLQANAYEARLTLNWNPEYCFDDLVEEMIQHDIKILSTRTR